MKELTKEWVDKAEQDFHSVGLLLHAGETPLTEPACFHCQQSAEKYLKAYLQEHEIEFERTHDLLPLLAMCVAVDDEFQILKEDMQELDRYAVVVRYPGVIVKAKAAEDALIAAKRVRRFLKRKLSLE
jgi:HEPN domain-containing protein